MASAQTKFLVASIVLSLSSACGGSQNSSASAASNPASEHAGGDLAGDDQRTSVSTGVSPTRNGEPAQRGIEVQGNRILCTTAHHSCEGEVNGRDGTIHLRMISESENALISYGSEYLVQTPQAHPRMPNTSPNGGGAVEGFLVPAPDAREQLAQVDLDAILGSAATQSPFSVILEIAWTDGETARGSIPISPQAASALLAELLFDVESDTGRARNLPLDDAYRGMPRGMAWTSSPAETIGTRGNAHRTNELDWVLRFDRVARSMPCGPRTRGRQASIEVQDIRGRVFERRTGRIIGERTLPDPRVDECSEATAQGTTRLRPAFPREVTSALVDWAWNELRSGN